MTSASPFRKSNSNCPGTSGYRYYGAHDYEHLFVWWPASGSFQNTGVLVFLHGGLGYNPGNRALAVDDPGGTGLATLMHGTHGWPIVSVEYPPCASNAVPKQEICNTALWPHQLFSVARALSFIRSHPNDSTPEGLAMWGAGNYIDPNKVCVLGDSYGGTLAMLIGLIPESYFAVGMSQALAFTREELSAGPRPRAVISNNGQADWTQFGFEVAASLGDVYANNIHQVFMYSNQNMQFGSQYSGGVIVPAANPLPEHIKRDASPWWWLKRRNPDARNTAFYLKWPQGEPAGTTGDNLTPEDWNPGSQRLDEAAGKAFYDPHHRFQALPMAQEMVNQGIPVRTVWGTAAANPGGSSLAGWNVNQDVVDAAWASPATARDQANWLVTTLGL